jgi:nucleotide-binding universal stress UspA family protein
LALQTPVIIFWWPVFKFWGSKSLSNKNGFMKNILVSIDFSAASGNAAHYAAAMAEDYGATITLVHAWEQPVAIGEVPSVIMSAEEGLQQEKEAEMKKEVEKISNSYEGLTVDSYVFPGSASFLINDIAKKVHADVVVMGMKGKGKSSGLFGSTVALVTRQSDIPVLAIPENVQYQPLYTITLATDFDGDTPLGTYHLLKALADKHNAYVQVLHIADKEPVLTADESAGKMKADLALTKLRHSFFTIEGEEVEEGINHFIEDHPSQMLAMVAHHHNFFQRLFGKVHTTTMAKQAKLPVLFLKE